MLARALERIKELERHLGLDSHDSSKPPSSDGAKQRAERPKKEKSERKRVGQKSHRRKLWTPDKADHFNSRFPFHSSDCGLELSCEDALGEPIRHKVIELAPNLIECTEHQLYSCQCPGCGHTSRAQFD